MNALGKITLVALAAALVVPALAGGHSYGRAGGAVGAQVEQTASYVSPRDLKEFDAGDGRAGGPVA